MLSAWGLEVTQKRTYDLLSMWVGGTEKKIAEAFDEARDAGAFLVFDEADSLLTDRRYAQRTWEISKVNEMLAWVENRPLPFACTTNLAGLLDPATMRRFTFKVAFHYLASAQAAAAFRRYFEFDPPESLTSLAILASGDFSVVHREAKVLGKLGDPEELAAMLRAECDAKRDGIRDVGFRAAEASQYG